MPLVSDFRSSALPCTCLKIHHWPRIPTSQDLFFKYILGICMYVDLFQGIDSPSCEDWQVRDVQGSRTGWRCLKLELMLQSRGTSSFSLGNSFLLLSPFNCLDESYPHCGGQSLLKVNRLRMFTISIKCLHSNTQVSIELNLGYSRYYSLVKLTHKMNHYTSC